MTETNRLLWYNNIRLIIDNELTHFSIESMIGNNMQCSVSYTLTNKILFISCFLMYLQWYANYHGPLSFYITMYLHVCMSTFTGLYVGIYMFVCRHLCMKLCVCKKISEGRRLSKTYFNADNEKRLMQDDWFNNNFKYLV